MTILDNPVKQQEGSTTRIYIAACIPQGGDGGVGGFDWSTDLGEAEAAYNVWIDSVQGDSTDYLIVLMSYDTELPLRLGAPEWPTDSDAVTEEIDEQIDDLVESGHDRLLTYTYKEARMSILEAAKKAAEARREAQDLKARTELYRATERVLAGHAPGIEAVEFTLGGRGVHSRQYVLTLPEGLRFTLFRGKAHVRNYREHDDDGPGWFWDQVECLADLGELDFPEEAAE